LFEEAQAPKSQLSILEDVLKSEIASRRSDRRQLPVVQNLSHYERDALKYTEVLDAPDQTRDTALRYISTDFATQVDTLQTAPLKLASAAKPQTPPKPDARGKVPSDEVEKELCLLRIKISDLLTSRDALAESLRSGTPSCSASALTLQRKLKIVRTEIVAFNSLVQDKLRKADNQSDPKQTPDRIVFDPWLGLIVVTAPKPPALAKAAPDNTESIKAESTALSRLDEICIAVVNLCARATELDTQRDNVHRRLHEGARTVLAELFPETTLAVSDESRVDVGFPSHSRSNQPRSKYAFTQVTPDLLARSYAEDLALKNFGVFLDLPLPVQFIDAQASPPSFKSIFTDFVPTLDRRFPNPADKIAITILGSGLDQVDLTSGPTPLELKSPEIPNGSVDPVTIIDLPTATSSSITFHIYVNPVYKLPLAFQFKLKNSTAVINTMPFAIARLPEDSPKNATIIRRLSGPQNDPTQQQRDEFQIIGAPPGAVTPDLLKAKIEENKPETRKKYDVNIDLTHKP
jgi:hypothetical protein